MSAVVLQNTKRKEYHCLYKLFCMIVVFFHLVYRCARKCCKGKVTGRLQPVLSVLALSCITSVCLLPSALDKGMISLGQAGLFSIRLFRRYGRSISSLPLYEEETEIYVQKQDFNDI